MVDPEARSNFSSWRLKRCCKVTVGQSLCDSAVNLLQPGISRCMLKRDGEGEGEVHLELSPKQSESEIRPPTWRIGGSPLTISQKSMKLLETFKLLAS